MEEQRKPWSGLAIASLVGGVLSLGLGFLTGIPAVICGHLGRARIRKSGGGLRGKGMALAGVVLGYLMSVVSVLGPGGLPTANAAIKRANVLRSRTMVVSTASAVEVFYQEYSKLPEPGVNDFNTEDPAGRKLLDMLLGPGNPRGVPFLVVEMGKTRKKGGLIRGAGSGGSIVGLFDAWGNPFRVILDDDYDEVIRFTYGGKPEVVHGKRVLVASRGPDGIEGTGDDVKSW
jgi:hypothetical protein